MIMLLTNVFVIVGAIPGLPVLWLLGAVEHFSGLDLHLPRTSGEAFFLAALLGWGVWLAAGIVLARFIS